MMIHHQTVSNWFEKYKIKAKKRRIIPIPPKEELIALYNGTHPDCNSKPFTQLEIAAYYSKKYSCPVREKVVRNWFDEYDINVRDYSLPIPPKEELLALYEGVHPETNGNPFTLDEIANYYSKKYNRSVSRRTIGNWFSYYNIRTRDHTFYDDWKPWQDIVYEIAEFVLSNEIWRSGHGRNKILLPNIPDYEHIEPEIIVLYKNREIKKLIDAKRTEYAVNRKNIEIYPFVSQMRLVEFWILFGDSRVEIHYSHGKIKNISLDEFDEEDYSDNNNYDKIFVYKSSNDLITLLQQKITEDDQESINNLIKRIQRLQRGISDTQTSLEDFFN